MNWDEIRRLLFSKDDVEISTGLSRFGGVRDELPPDDLSERATQLLWHPDADVRSLAVFGLGIHWRAEEAFLPILTLLRPDEDEHLLGAVVIAIGSLIGAHPGSLRRRGLSELVGAAASADFPRSVRGLAYLDVQLIVGVISKREIAARSLHPDDVEIDPTFLDSVRSELDSHRA